jgi:ornithine cyclodeaminase/alanine dehydrogenase-like protein (mu-crystallin family)
MTAPLDGPGERRTEDDLLIVDGRTVHELLPLAEAIGLMAEVFRNHSAHRSRQPLRSVLVADGAGALATMPAVVAGPDADSTPVFGVKVMVIKPGNARYGLGPHSGVVLVFDAETGRPSAVIDGVAVTAVRTAAASAAATRALARADSGILAVLGAGTQARSHIAAMAEVLPALRQVRVWNRSREHALQLVDWARKTLPAVEVRYEPEVGAAARGSDVICTTTASDRPLLSAEMLAPGTHINAIGASFRGKRELDTSVVQLARVFVDSRESALNEADDLLIPMQEGRLAADCIRAEIGEVLLGDHPGRTSDDHITVFKSLGIAAQDVAAAHRLQQRARESGAGIRVPAIGVEPTGVDPHPTDRS